MRAGSTYETWRGFVGTKKKTSVGGSLSINASMVGFKHFYLESEGNGGLVTGVRKCNLKAKKVKFNHRKYFKKRIKKSYHLTACPSKIINGRHKRRSGRHTLARQKNIQKKILQLASNNNSSCYWGINLNNYS